jgi:anti-sigma B factor antagonist
MPEPAIFAPAGEIDLHSTDSVQEQIEPFLSVEKPRLLVDMSGVTYVDSSALALLIEAMQRAQAAGGAFALCGLRESIRHVFAISRLDHVFQIFPTREEALAGMP